MNNLIKISVDISNKNNPIIINNSTKYNLINANSKSIFKYTICSEKNNIIFDIFETFSITSPIYLLRNKNKKVIASIQKNYDIRGLYFDIKYIRGSCFIKNTFDENIIEISRNNEVLGIITKIKEGSIITYCLNTNNILNEVFTISLFITYVKILHNDNEVPDSYFI